MQQSGMRDLYNCNFTEFILTPGDFFKALLESMLNDHLGSPYNFTISRSNDVDAAGES
jgi:hypothetical protein